jgi:uncharacterized protein YndB with AHSA1/START domain
MRTFVAGLAIIVFLSFPLAGQEVTDSSHAALDGTRVLQQSIDVPASILEVWEALTTSEGLRSWAVPMASVDFRLGGIWESSYRHDAAVGDPANIKNRFLAFLPPRLLVIQAVQAPPDFPHPELLPEIFTVFESAQLGPELTRVTVSMVGYREGDGYDAIYRLFERGNEWTLRKLRTRFSDGPVDWQKTLPSAIKN